MPLDSSKNNIRILLVEDEVITARFIKNQLEKVGYEVASHVTTGEKAIRTVENISPDIILMDIRLAGELDGIEASKIILTSIKKIPIIFLTGYDDLKYKQRAEKLSPLGYLVKPANINEIKSIIENYFKPA